MSLTTSPEVSVDAARLTAMVAEQVKGNWLHNIEFRDDKTIVTPDSYEYRRRCLESLFGSLFVDRSVLVLDEASGFYPALIQRAGARFVSAANVDVRSCELIEKVSQFLDIGTTVVNRQLLSFFDGEPYVDMEFEEAHEFLFALGEIWSLFGSSGESFDAIAEALAFFVSDGVVFDWTDASWASPPPPAEYNLEELCAALRRKFEFVTVYGRWLVVALGKLPQGAVEDHGEYLLAQVEAEPASVSSARGVNHTGPASYEEFLPCFRNTVCGALPPDATVGVVSRGDPEMLALEGRAAWHFPRGTDGEYTGYHPKDSASAIAHLEEMQAAGAQFLVFPKSAFWWLDHYRGLRDHLVRDHELLLEDDSCLIYALHATEARSDEQ